jgi:hypothetical protein
MQKTPSYLKGLAETRARAAGEVERYSALLTELQAKLDQSRAELEACDRLIQRFDVRLDPSQIQTIHAWQGRYGPRGELQRTVLKMLQDAYPAAVTTTMASIVVRATLKLDFPTRTALSTWSENSLRSVFKQLVKVGLVERLHELRNTGQVGIWRWIAPVDSLEGLATMATSAGVKTTEATDFVPDEEPSEADGLPS